MHASERLGMAAGTSRESSPAGSDTDRQSRCSTPDAQVVQEYNELMGTILAAVAPIAVAQSIKEHVGFEEEERTLGRPLTKAEKQNAKKKRRKERERDARAEEARAQREMKQKEQEALPVEFKLFSSRPVQSVSLVHAKEEYPIPDNPRHVPLARSIADSIRSCAASAAVDAPDLGGVFPTRARPGKSLTLRARGPLPRWIVDYNASGPIGSAVLSLVTEQPAKRQRTRRTKRPKHGQEQVPA